MKIGAAISTAESAEQAGTQAFEEASIALGGDPIHLACLFVSPTFVPRIDEVVGALMPRLGHATLIGCSSNGTIGGSREVEQGPAVSVWLASMPEATITPFELVVENTPDGQAVVGFPLIQRPMKAMLLLADPYSFPTEHLLGILNTDYPDLPIFGGQTSGQAGGNMLILNNKVIGQGAVGVLLGGGIRVTPLVSQGCKPIGQPYVVTEVTGNILRQIGGVPPLTRLKETLADLPPQVKRAMSTNLQLGVVIDEHKLDPEAGDFLIRGLIQADPNTGAMSVGETLSVGQTVQFQVRDAASADADLKGMLESRMASVQTPPQGALLFTCNGRGSNLFGVEDHDASEIRSALGGLPLAGMFCGGEIGPIGGTNFLHGFTASVALFDAVEPKSLGRSRPQA
jgi:small ligand-binding sensory domain FIST